MTREKRISSDIRVEDLALDYPEAVGFLVKQGVRCIRCGEPVWGTLGELLEEAGIANPQSLIDELKAFLSQK